VNWKTLLGVGSGAGSLAGNTTTIGGIGTGYIYADWKAQAAYTSPNFSGFQFTLAATQGWNTINNAGGAISLATTGRSGSAPAAEGQLSYTFGGGAVSGKLWTSGIVQKVNHNSNTVTLDDDRAQAADIGANVNFGDIGLTGYAYKADGLGTTIQFMDAYTAGGKQRKSDGGYVQATYTMPTKTKIGVAYGISNLDRHSSDSDTTLVKENERTTVGAYHPLTKHLNTVLEYNEGKSQNQAGAENKARTLSLGAILFF